MLAASVSVEFLDAGLLDVGLDSLLLLFEAVISEKYISFFLIDIIPMKTYFLTFGGRIRFLLLVLTFVFLEGILSTCYLIKFLHVFVIQN